MSTLLTLSFAETKELEFKIQNVGTSYPKYSGYFRVIIKNSSGKDVSYQSNLFFSKKHGYFYFPIGEVNARAFFHFPKIESSELFSTVELRYIPDYSKVAIPKKSFGKIILVGQQVGNYQRFEIQDGE